MIRLIAFDADDTLWHSERFYLRTNERIVEIVSRYLDWSVDEVAAALYPAETKNLKVFGYGAKALTLSMIESALEVTNCKIDGSGIREILRLGLELLQHPVELLPGAHEVLTELSQHRELLLLTKGDLFHQETKIAQAQVSEFFRTIEIVSEKERSTYENILHRNKLRPEELVMIGNSFRSDIGPVLDLGGWGVHIPYETTWAHEANYETELTREKLFTLSSISEVPFVLDEIENQLKAMNSAFA